MFFSCQALWRNSRCIWATRENPRNFVPCEKAIITCIVYCSRVRVRVLGQTNLICCFSSAPASTSNTPLQLSLLPFASGTPPINSINNHVMSRETSLMASAHGHLSQARCHSFACQYYMAVGQLFRGQSLEFL